MSTLLKNDPVRWIKGWLHTQRWAVMRLPVTKWINLLHFVAGLEPEHFKLASGKGKGSRDYNTIDWNICHHVFPKGSSGYISWVAVLKKKSWYKKGAWCGCNHLIWPNHRHVPALFGGWVTQWTLALFKATRVAGQGFQHGISPPLTEAWGGSWKQWTLCSLQEQGEQEFTFHPCDLATKSKGHRLKPPTLVIAASGPVYMLSPPWQELQPISLKFTGLGHPRGRVSSLVNYFPYILEQASLWFSSLLPTSSATGIGKVLKGERNLLWPRTLGFQKGHATCY